MIGLHEVTIDGRRGLCAYFGVDGSLVNPEDAVTAKVVFDDGRRVFYTVRQPTRQKYSPDQPRDDRGRWTGTGGAEASVRLDVSALETGEAAMSALSNATGIKVSLNADEVVEHVPNGAIKDSLKNQLGQVVDGKFGWTGETPLAVEAMQGIADGWKDLETADPEEAAYIKENIAIATSTSLPPTTLAMTVSDGSYRPGSKAVIAINTSVSPQQMLEGLDNKHLAIRDTFKDVTSEQDRAKLLYRYVITHELGHVVDHLRARDTRQFPASMAVAELVPLVAHLENTTAQEYLSKNLSGYAASSAKEAWAEIYAAYRFGVPLPEALQNLAKAYSSVKPHKKSLMKRVASQAVDAETQAWTNGQPADWLQLDIPLEKGGAAKYGPEKAEWNEADHPRVPSGSPDGGQFTDGNGGAGGQTTAETPADREEDRLKREADAGIAAIEKHLAEAVEQADWSDTKGKEEEVEVENEDEGTWSDIDVDDQVKVRERWMESALNDGDYRDAAYENIDRDDYIDQDALHEDEQERFLEAVGDSLGVEVRIKEQVYVPRDQNDPNYDAQAEERLAKEAEDYDWRAAFERDDFSQLETINGTPILDRAESSAEQSGILPIEGEAGDQFQPATIGSSDLSSLWEDAKESALDKARDKVGDDDAYIEAVGEEELRLVNDAWHDLGDDEKLQAAAEMDIFPEGGGTRTEMQYQPLEPGEPSEWKWRSDDKRDEDYQRSKVIAQKLLRLRTTELMRERGIDTEMLPEPSTIRDLVWRKWEESPMSDLGIAFQVAVSEELGIQNRFTSTEVKAAREAANKIYENTNGYDMLKVYARAQWETSQFVMAKSNADALNTYRSFSVKSSLVDQAKQTTVGDHVRLTDAVWIRNPAQSVTLDREVANNYTPKDGERRIVFRITAPRSSAISVPLFGNSTNESELVLAGGPGRWSWDGWLDNAPSQELQKAFTKASQQMPAPGQIVIDMREADRGPHWLYEIMVPTRIERGAVSKYSPDQPRVPAGSPDGGQFAPVGGTENLGSEIDETSVLNRLMKPDAGMTLNVLDGSEVKIGDTKFAVAIFEGRGKMFPADAPMTPRDLAKFIRGNRSLLSTPGNYFGAWHDPKTHDVWLDISVVTDSRDEAERIGREHKQVAYFDFSAGKSVDIPEHRKYGRNERKVHGHGRSSVGRRASEGSQSSNTRRDPSVHDLSVRGADGPDADRRRDLRDEGGATHRRRSRVVAKYSPDQPRVPAGRPDGGQWIEVGGPAAERPTVPAGTVAPVPETVGPSPRRSELDLDPAYAPTIDPKNQQRPSIGSDPAYAETAEPLAATVLPQGQVLVDMREADQGPHWLAGGDVSAQFAGEDKFDPVDMVARDGVMPDEMIAHDKWLDRDTLSKPISQTANSADGIGGGHVNEVYHLELENGREKIFKPEDGERWGIRSTVTNKDATLAEREVLASRLDRALGFGLVPHAELGEVTADNWARPRRGAVIQYVDHDKEDQPDHDGGAIDRLSTQEVAKLAILDTIMGNTDRHRNNFMVAQSGRMVAIDNGYTFNSSRWNDDGIFEMRSFAPDLIGNKQSLSKETQQRIAKRIANMKWDKILSGSNLNDDEVSALKQRAGRMVDVLNEGRVGDLWELTRANAY